MPRLRYISIAFAVTALLAGGGFLYAQGGAANLPEISIPTEEEIATLSPDEMRERTTEMIAAMQSIHENTVELQRVAREARDVIRLNCVNDKLLQIKQLLNIAETSRNDLIEAISASDDAARIHHFTQVAVSYENVVALQTEAEGCVGEETIYLGPTDVQVTGPDIVDDPTAEDPFPGFEIEDPAYASPYF